MVSAKIPKKCYQNIIQIAKFEKFQSFITPPIAEILCVKNARAIVVCGFLMKLFKNIYAESLKKIVGAVWELPAKQHSQSSAIWMKMGWIDRI